MSDVRRAAQPELPKRFYAEATVAPAAEGGGFGVLLDGRPLRTPRRRLLALPNEPLAEATAAEWRAQGERIDPATMPLTRLANTVIDGVADDPAPVRDEAASFAETDLLFYRADGPEALAERQRHTWDPVLAWIERAHGAAFVLGAGVMHVRQPEAALAAIRRRFAAETDPFRVAALHQITSLTGSALLALAVADRHLGFTAAWDAAHVDEDWNREQWGADEEADARRAARLSDMRAAALMLGDEAADQIPANQSYPRSSQ